MIKLKDIWRNIITENQKSNFARWFNGSKITTGSKPLICYHGTNIKFDSFDPNKKRSGWLSTGFYFTAEKAEAKHYGSIIISCYLSIKNPYIVKADTINDDGTVNFSKDVKGQLIDDFPEIKNLNWEDVSDFLENKGYDGIMNSVNLIVCFNPNQIKSTKNNGGWSLTDDNIYN